LTAKNVRYDGDCGPAYRFSGIGPWLYLQAVISRIFSFATVWALYHQTETHYGFAVIYKIKNEILRKWTNFLDRAFLLANFLGPLFVFVTRRSGFLARAAGA